MSTTYTFGIEGMHCGSCAMLIDDALEDLPGVRSARTSVRQGISVVELEPGDCTPGEVITAIEELGYTAHRRFSESPEVRDD